MAFLNPPLTQTSLEDIHSSVPIPGTRWRRFLAFSGPAFLVSVGYMDPGNWGADLKAGSQFQYRLLWVLLLSNMMAVLLQSLSARLGVVTGRDLAQACREGYPRPTAWGLWILCEIAIAATDLAEVIGTIVALKLLFDVHYLVGLGIAACDTFLLLALQRRGVRLLEVLTLLLIAVIGVSFVVEIVLCRPRPDWLAVAWGFFPGLPRHYYLDSLKVAIAMLGATVMPHNLYLHSALVQTRAFPRTVEGKRLACKYNFLDSLLAMNVAFFINAAILILAGAIFFDAIPFALGEPVPGLDNLGEAHRLLGESAWGAALASALFAIALLASGQSSTLTGTLAGQVVMEGFVQLRLRPWVRRLVTRMLAIAPALVVLGLASSGQAFITDDPDELLMDLLVTSQLVLAFQLPFAIIPLIQFTSDRRRMGMFASRPWLRALAWLSAGIVVAFNGVASALQIQEWADKAGEYALWVYIPLGLAATLITGFLGWITLYPLLRRRAQRPTPLTAPVLSEVRYGKIGVAVEFAGADDAVLARAAALAREHRASLVLFHVVEGAGALLFGEAADDQESRQDRARMSTLAEFLKKDGLDAQGVLGYGNPAQELVRLANEHHIDLLVLGTHGHRFLADLALGHTVAPVLHRLTIPVLVVPTSARERET